MKIILLSLLIILISIVSFFIGPMIKGNNYTSIPKIGVKNFYGVKIDCDFISDFAKNEEDKLRKKFIKGQGNKCKRFAAMGGLEFMAFSLSFSIGFIYLFLSIKLHNDEIKLNTIIQLIPTGLGFISSILYTGFNGYIFINDSPVFILDNLVSSNNDYINGFIKTTENGVFAKLDESTGKYYLLNPKKNDFDFDTPYIKFKDLKNKQYNYNKAFYFQKFFGENEEFYNCQYNDVEKFHYGDVAEKTYTDNSGNLITCKNLYYYNFNEINYNKYIYNRWLITLILACFTCLIELLLFILYCSKNMSNSPQTIPID